MRLYKSIIVDSQGGGDCRLFVGAATVSGNNFIEDGSCSATLSSADGVIKLGAVTRSPAYFPLLDGSVAIDAGHADHCPNVDQAGNAVTPRDSVLTDYTGGAGAIFVGLPSNLTDTHSPPRLQLEGTITWDSHSPANCAGEQSESYVTDASTRTSLDVSSACRPPAVRHQAAQASVLPRAQSCESTQSVQTLPMDVIACIFRNVHAGEDTVLSVYGVNEHSVGYHLLTVEQRQVDAATGETIIDVSPEGRAMVRHVAGQECHGQSRSRLEALKIGAGEGPCGNEMGRVAEQDVQRLAQPDVVAPAVVHFSVDQETKMVLKGQYADGRARLKDLDTPDAVIDGEGFNVVAMSHSVLIVARRDQAKSFAASPMLASQAVQSKLPAVPTGLAAIQTERAQRLTLNQERVRASADTVVPAGTMPTI